MTFIEHLNLAQERLLDPKLRRNEGLGNEIGFYIFDYPPEKELEIRDYIAHLPTVFERQTPPMRVHYVNLFSLVVDYLKQRNLWEKACVMQKERGNEALQKALRASLGGDKIADFFSRAVKPEEYDLIILFGVGEAYPLLRSHTLLNNLHARMGTTPLVMFFPGEYTMQGLRLFNTLSEDNYYRAFRLVA